MLEFVPMEIETEIMHLVVMNDSAFSRNKPNYTPMLLKL